MSEQIEYIEPTQEHVGQMVEVRDHNAHNWRKAKLCGLIGHDFKFIAHEVGGVPVGWRQARIARPLTYAERQAKCGLKVGDRVRFVRAWEGGSELCHVTYTSGMDDFIGQVGTITEECSSGLDVKFARRSYWLPYFVLEKVEDRVATFNDMGKQVYVEGTPGDVFTFEIVYGIEGDVWRAVVRSGDKRFVYELSNLRVKE